MPQILVDSNTLATPDYYKRKEDAESKQRLLDMGWSAEHAALAFPQALPEQELVAGAARRRGEIDELKKKWGADYLKYVPIPDRPIPRGTLVPLAAPYAVRRLEEGKYIAMYYYTNRGLDAAAAEVAQAVDDVPAMTWMCDSDGTISCVPAASMQRAKDLIPDSELTWTQFEEAAPRFLVAMRQADWAWDRVRMLADLWNNLRVHPSRQSHDPLDARALLTYQAEQRQRWHRAIPSHRGASEEILRDTYHRVYQADRAAKDAVNDAHWDALRVSLDQASPVQSPSSHRGADASVDGSAVRTKPNRKRTSAPYPSRKPPSFPSGAGGSVRSACAICLGRHQHHIYSCDAEKTWDSSFDTITKRIRKSIVLTDGGHALCYDWQRPAGCASRSHDARHLCSGCGQATHGAQQCPRTQRVGAADVVSSR